MNADAIDPATLIPRLIVEFGYPDPGARLVAERLAAATPAVRSAFLHWWRQGERPALAVEGYTVARLAAEQGMSPIAAFLTLDWLARAPDAALGSLRRGHDRILGPARRPRDFRTHAKNSTPGGP